MTLEFLSSCCLQYYEDHFNSTISFCLFGKKHVISGAKLGEYVVSLLMRIHRLIFPQEFDKDSVWRSISYQGGAYTHATSKSTSLNWFSQCITHRWLVLSLFGKGESQGYIIKKDLLNVDCFNRGVNFNVGSFVMEHLVHVTNKQKDGILVGGVITALAVGMKLVNPKKTTSVSINVNNRIQASTFVDMEMAKKGPMGAYYLSDKRGRPLKIPDDGREPQLDMAPPDDQPTTSMDDSTRLL
ncbi:hypothetical protein JCGZ_03842 [Jatropha curcas]|uniref:Uncharacterized protein n=1 Tax=Jatropha curcas TaxID=180498 RepID=A0A067KW93_JATCU|nr:hypothetical protein JCGZ_03842 [Jatropha curcas]